MHVRGSVIDVVIDRAPGNLFTTQMCETLSELLVRPPDGTHVMHLAGTADMFCLGRERGGAGVEELRVEVEALVRLNRALVASPLVTIAEVTGPAAGFGVGVAALCDIAISSDTATYRFPEIGIGLAPSLVLAWLAKAVGRREAFWLTATGSEIDAARATELGLVNEHVPPEELAGRVAAVEELVLSKPQRVHREIKELLELFAESSRPQSDVLAADRLVLASLPH